MYNPSTSKADCNLHAGMVNQDSQNTPQTSNRESYNTFDKSRVRFTTARFDEIQPVYFDPSIEADVRRLRNVHDLRTYTLKSPLLSNVKLHRTFFSVPWSTIAPNTWEYLYRQPVHGSDIDYKKVAPNLNLTNFVTYLDTLQQKLYNVGTEVASPSSTTTGVFFATLIRLCLIVNGYMSKASLCRCLGGRFPLKYDADAMYERLVQVLSNTIPEDAGVDNLGILSMSFIGDGPDLDIDIVGGDIANPGFRYFIGLDDVNPAGVFNFLREYSLYGFSNGDRGDPAISFSSSWSDATFISTNAQKIVEYVFGSARPFNPSTVVYDNVKDTYNLMPLIAYQCAVAQFYTNSHIDAVYSAKMWQDNARSALYEMFNHLTPSALRSYDELYFNLNGVSVPYDAYSGIMIDHVLSSAYSSEFWNRFSADFNYRYHCVLQSYLFEPVLIGQSLRYGDYFTTGRPQPLAVGDVTVTVNEGQSGQASTVNVIDVNQKLWVQRFLNAVNRTKQTIYDYIYAMAGVSPERRESQPNFICSEVYNIAGMEVENTTSQDQGNIVTLLRNSESRYMYEVMIDEPSFIIGLDSFSVQYAYPDAMNHIYKMDDRLDWFNHFMQHVGDRPLDYDELSLPKSKANFGEPFAYALMYWNFKTAISDAVGGFIDGSLPSWAVFYDIGHWDNSEASDVPYINSAFIRNHNEDFDKLYASLTGESCANRFHFIKSIYFSDMVNSRQQAYPALI